MQRILAVNPGSTSTKIAVYENEQAVLTQSLSHDSESLRRFPTIFDQFEFRKDIILKVLVDAGISPQTLTAVVGRGGTLRPLSGGVYRVNRLMIEDCRVGYAGTHAANLGAVIAQDIAGEYGLPAFIVDPPVIDEFEDLARMTGHPGIERKSKFHALNQKATARRAARELGLDYHRGGFVVAHMGGGITVGAHKAGRVVDVNDGYDSEGPMSPERAGSLPAGDLARICFSGDFTHAEIKRMLVGGGGLVAHLGTNDMREVRTQIASGNRKAERVYKAMAYQIAKEIGKCAAVLSGDVDAIVLTGGLAYDEEFTALIKERVDWIAQVKVYPGENEMEALALGALRVLSGEEQPKDYDQNNIVVPLEPVEECG